MKTEFFSHIRKALPTDYPFVAPLIVQAMEDLACTFANTKDPEKTFPLFEYFFQRSQNQYSFENTLVYEENGVIAGSITAYNGALLPKYRKPFLDYIASHYNVKDLVIENETMSGELYIDTLSVYPHHQGKGIGKKLLIAMQEKAAKEGHKKIGLLVDYKNPGAKKLYTSLGYKTIDTKQLGDGKYEHLQLDL